jgi:hypothetical protein
MWFLYDDPIHGFHERAQEQKKGLEVRPSFYTTSPHLSHKRLYRLSLKMMNLAKTTTNFTRTDCLQGPLSADEACVHFRDLQWRQVIL